MTDNEQLTREQAEAAFALVKEHLATADPSYASDAILQEPGIQCTGWAITLECDMESWPVWVNDKIGELGWPDGVFAEPVTHCHLGLYVLWSPRIKGNSVTWVKGPE